MATTTPSRPDHPRRRRGAFARRSAGGSAPTSRPPSCTRTPSGPARAWSPPTARSSCGPASTPVARPRTSSSSTSRRATTRSGGARSTGRSARRTTTACGRASSPTAPSATSTPRTCLIGADPAHQRRLRVYHRDRLGQPLRAEPVPPSEPRATRGLRAELHDHLRAVVPGRPGDRGHPDRDRDPAPPPADGDHHRRHRVRGRDQEVARSRS